MYPDDKPKGMLDFGKKTQVVVKAAASAALAYFAVRLLIGAATDGGINQEGTYFLWGCGILFAVCAVLGGLVVIRDIRALMRRKESVAKNKD